MPAQASIPLPIIRPMSAPATAPGIAPTPPPRAPTPPPIKAPIAVVRTRPPIAIKRPASIPSKMAQASSPTCLTIASLAYAIWHLVHASSTYPSRRRYSSRLLDNSVPSETGLDIAIRGFVPSSTDSVWPCNPMGLPTDVTPLPRETPDPATSASCHPASTIRSITARLAQGPVQFGRSGRRSRPIVSTA